MANAHFTAAIPNGEYCELNQTYNPLKEGIFKEPLTVRDGHTVAGKTRFRSGAHR